jgi:predicted GNAT family acetyltransferase
MENQEVVVKRLADQADANNAYGCFNDDSSPWKDALCACREWVSQNLGRFVEGYHLETGAGVVVGHLYYAISPQALLAYQIEPGLAVLYCEWVKRSYQGQGYGRLLFENFLAEMKAKNALGVLVEVSSQDERMKEDIFTTRGFHPIHTAENKSLLYLPLTRSEVQASPLAPAMRPRRGAPVEVVILYGFACPFDYATRLSLRQVAGEFGQRAALREVHLTPETIKEFGASGGIFINGKQKLSGGEPEIAIRRAIAEELNE